MARLISSATNESSTPVRFNYKVRGQYRPIHFEISAAATVVLEARAAPDLDWLEVITVTATGGENVLVFYEMRVTITDNTGNVEVELDATRGK